LLWLELDKRNLLLGETFVADPLRVDLLGQEVESCLGQSSADPVEPEVAAGLAQDCLVIVMDLFMADATGIYRWSVGVLWVEDHRLVYWVNLLRRHRERSGSSHAGMDRTGPSHPWVDGAGVAHGGMAW